VPDRGDLDDMKPGVPNLWHRIPKVAALPQDEAMRQPADEPAVRMVIGRTPGADHSAQQGGQGVMLGRVVGVESR